MKLFLALSLIVLLSGILSAQSEPLLQVNELDAENTGPWSEYGGSRYKTGKTNIDAPDANVSVAWTYTTYGSIRTGAAVDHNDRIIFGSNDNWLYCIRNNGSLVWKYNIYNDISTVPAIGPGGNIFVGSDDNYMYCFFHDGYMKWRFNGNSDITGYPTVDDYGTVYFGTRYGYIYAVRNNGSQKWRTRIDSNGYAFAPTLDKSNGIFTVAAYNIYMLEMSGSTRWYYTTADHYFPGSVDANGRIYFAGTSNALYCHDPNNSTIIWTYRLSNECVVTPSIDSNGNAYVGTRGYNLHSIDKDGRRNWVKSVNDRIDVQAIIDKDNDIIFTTIDGWLHCYKQDGTKRWAYSLGTGTTSQLAITKAGLIIIGLNDGKLVAVGGNTSFECNKYAKQLPSKFEILGNPVKTELRIRYTISDSGTLSIYSLTGKRIAISKLSPVRHTFSWNVPKTISNGVYLVQIDSSNKIMQKRFMLLR